MVGTYTNTVSFDVYKCIIIVYIHHEHKGGEALSGQMMRDIYATILGGTECEWMNEWNILFIKQDRGKRIPLIISLPMKKLITIR